LVGGARTPAALDRAWAAGAAVASIREIGTLCGLRIVRRELGSPDEFTRLSDTELMELVQGEVELIALPDLKA
jgi:hypothetical protein